MHPSFMRTATVALLSSSFLLGNTASAQNVMFRYSPDPLTVERLAISPVSIPDIYVGEAVNETVSGDGGVGNLTWRVEGELPSGLTLLPNGVLTGTSSTSGTYSVSFIATDEVGDEASYGPLELNVYENITASDLFDAITVDQPLSKSAPISGGKAPYSLSLISGALPSGVEFDGTKLIGTPTDVAIYSSVVEVKDANDRAANFEVGLTVLDELRVSGILPDAYVSENYLGELVGKGGSGIYSWSSSADLPSGVDFQEGIVSGVFSSTGQFTIDATVSDGYDFKSASRAITAYNLPAISSKDYADPYVGTEYLASLGVAPTVSGGKGPFSWSATGLPSGLNIGAADGAISGTPTSAGNSTVVVTAQDANGRAASRSFGFATRAALALGAKTYDDPYVGSSYTAGSAPSATGGKTPYIWSASGLPAGLSINSGTGVVSGTPTSAASASALITLRDNNNVSVSRSYAFAPRGALALGSKTYADPYMGTAYTSSEGAAPSATGGLTPYRWSANGLPSGLSMNATTGVISGTATNSTATTATIAVSDANGVSIAKTFNFAPRAVLAASNKMPSTVEMTTAVDETMTATGGKAPYTYTATGLPSGLSMSTAGRVTGTPTAIGTFKTVVTVRDANGKTASASKTVVSERGEIVVSMSGGNGTTTLRSLFSSSDWASATPKIVNLASGQIRGSTSASDVVTIGGAWGGTLTFNIAGEIRGKSGAANGGAGGNAFNAETKGASGQRIAVKVTGAVRGGGGGGGKGGQGGQGGSGTTTSTSREPKSGENYDSSDWRWSTGGGERLFIDWNGSRIYTSTSNIDRTSYTTGGYTYYRGSKRLSNGIYGIYRVKETSVTVSGGDGGSGGNGGRGVGYDISAASGSNGAAGEKISNAG